MLDAILWETAEKRAVALSATISPIRVPLIQDCLDMRQHNTRLVGAGHALVRGKDRIDHAGVCPGREKTFQSTLKQIRRIKFVKMVRKRGRDFTL